ncbi:hypothetical protein CPC08DRAFT_669781 [Agrocybe pediades]|nr:hypothetical protein CPC08DRAFT_669781 [Agrocybe pediades]
MALLLSTHYILEAKNTVTWTQTQEKTISAEYPFSLVDEPLDQYVARIYLQFLWLPESIMPLNLLIPSMSRISVPSTSDASQVHPMHAFLEPLLLTTRMVTQKYHEELPQILADGGGAGEMEETMMWYALTHEKADEDTPVPDNQEGPWVDEKWQQKYMDRMEKRELQIQILLYLFKLSLPGPPPPEKKKKRKRRKQDEEPPALSVEDRLEAFMDKLSMRQLVSSLDRTAPSMPTNTSNSEEKEKDERDWIQIFAEDIVDKSFKSTLPELCKLFHSKVFPSSPFSDDENNDNTSDPFTQPQQPTTSKPTRSLSRAPSLSRHPSVSLLPSPTHSTTTTHLVRSRSRSLSVSLAQEKEERTRAANALPTKKRAVVNREVSMSRVFKPKPKPSSSNLFGQSQSQDGSLLPKTAKHKEPVAPPPKKAKLDLGVTLVEETPEKPRVAVPPPPGRSGSMRALDFGVTLVEETPEKPRVARSGSTRMFGQPVFGFATRTKANSVRELEGIDGDEDEWLAESSPPNVISFSPTPTATQESSLLISDDDEDEDEVMATPSKPWKGRRR